MTFCGFDNVYDYCEYTQDYNYYYTRIIESNGKLVVDKSYSSPILRVNTETQEESIITFDGIESALLPCDQFDGGDLLSDWECYLVWKNTHTTLDPSQEVWVEARANIVKQQYDREIANGYKITLNNGDVFLPRDKDSQLKILSTLVNSIVSDTDPVIQDVEGNDITLSKQILQSNIDNYVESNRKLESAKNEALARTEANNSVDINVLQISLSDPQDDCGPGYDKNGGSKCQPII